MYTDFNCFEAPTHGDLADGAAGVLLGVARLGRIASWGIGPDDMIPEGISFDIANPKYRRFKSGDSILEYTLEAGEITVDWISGTSAASMMKSILEAEGAEVTRISGYATDKLGEASNAALQRFGQRIASKLGDGWTAEIETIRNRRYVVFTR